MGTSRVKIKELRFVIEEKQTHAYVLFEDLTPGETPIGAAGWHHKAFPENKAVIDILKMMMNPKNDPLLWPLEAP